MMNITMNVIYISLANIPTFFAEKVVCVSEQAEGLYSGLAYLLASTVSSIPVAAVSILAGTLIQYLITGPDPVYYRWYLFPEVYLNAFLLYLATDSLFQFFAVTQKSSAEAQNVALFFFGFISMFNGVAPTPSAFRVKIKFQALTPSTRRRPRDCVCKVAIPRHRCDVVPLTAEARRRRGSRRSPQ